jgi:hypothetical protein
MPVTYEHDIRPKFRTRDINCMTPRGYPIGDAQWMCDPAAGNDFADHGNARLVFSVLSAGQMPPDGTWSQDWLDTYQAWMAGGFQA